MNLVWDIETGPLSIGELAKVMPEFSAGANLKDPDKIAVAIEAKRAAWLDEAALSAQTGKVIAIGVMAVTGDDASTEILDGDGDEAELLRQFWSRLEDCHHAPTDGRMIGFNCHAFDAPYLCRRAWILNVPVPKWLRRGRFFHDSICDLLEIWRCGDRTEKSGGLDYLAKVFGIDGKTEKIGANFATVWGEDRPRAEAYLRRDLEITAELARRLGFL